MSETSWAKLRQLMVHHYDEFNRRLVRRLGSKELADEVLHETYLRLHRGDAAGAIHKPASYIFRIALNIATDRRRDENRRVSRAEVLRAIRLQDDERDLSQEMEARLQVNLLREALAELTPRRRAILIGARLEGLSHDTLASRFGISRTMVQRELRSALDHCLKRLGENDDAG
jgi:RNA polymerase sigma-70 factor (ECF subfamily)